MVVGYHHFRKHPYDTNPQTREHDVKWVDSLNKIAIDFSVLVRDPPKKILEGCIGVCGG